MNNFAPIAAAFDRAVHQVPDDAWDAPAPCEGWTARDVVGHLSDWVPGVIGRSGVEFAAMPSADVDPVAAWRSLHRTLTEALDDPLVREREFDAGPPGVMSVAQAIEMLVVGDLFIHTWDLGRAAGIEVQLDEQFAAGMLAGLEPIDEMLRASGHYGPKVAVPAGASTVDRLLAFTGRNPAWRAAG